VKIKKDSKKLSFDQFPNGLIPIFPGQFQKIHSFCQKGGFQHGILILGAFFTDYLPGKGIEGLKLYLCKFKKTRCAPKPSKRTK